MPPELTLCTLCARLRSDDAAVRQLALMDLAEVADATVLDPVLAAAAGDPDPTVRRMAVALLEELGEPRAASTLIGEIGRAHV